MAANCVTMLTAPGAAAIAVLRLSGPGVDSFLVRHFSKPVPMGRCVHGLLQDGDRVIDDIVAVRSGDLLDLNVHGGTWVVQSAMQLAQTAGFEISAEHATDGPTELWNEVLRALPLAVTEQAARMLLAQPAAWESITLPADILKDYSGKWLIQRPRVAIVGPANVGKSTLANQLFGQARSITADVPGTTRDWVGEIANLDGFAVMLLDTPGIRHTSDAIEAAAIHASADQIRSADLVVLVLDQSLPLALEMLEQYPRAIRVANKADAPAWEATKISAIRTVATLGKGMNDLRTAIRRTFGFEPTEIDRPRWWTERQRQELIKNTAR